MPKIVPSIFVLFTILLNFQYAFPAGPEGQIPPETVPAVVAPTPENRPLYFNEYPFFAGTDGLFSPNTQKSRSLFLNGHYFYNSGIFQGFLLRLQLAPSPTIHFLLQFSDFTENSAAYYRHFRDLNLYMNYNWKRNPAWWSWGGAGIRYSTDSGTWGPGIDAGADFFFSRPFSLRLSGNLNWIDARTEGNLIFRLNFHYRRDVFYLGYQLSSLNRQISSGAILGVGIYF